MNTSLECIRIHWIRIDMIGGRRSLIHHRGVVLGAQSTAELDGPPGACARSSGSLQVGDLAWCLQGEIRFKTCARKIYITHIDKLYIIHITYIYIYIYYILYILYIYILYIYRHIILHISYIINHIISLSLSLTLRFSQYTYVDIHHIRYVSIHNIGR